MPRASTGKHVHEEDNTGVARSTPVEELKKNSIYFSMLQLPRCGAGKHEKALSEDFEIVPHYS